MLSTRERLAARQGQSGTPRHEHLQALVREYARSPHWLRKEEIVAHLGNFAYDPINYGVLQRLRVMELFVEIVTSYGDVGPQHTQDQDQHDGPEPGRATRDEHFERRRREESASAARSKALLVEFAMGGICNCVPDPSLQLTFIECGGVPAVLKRVEAISMDAFHDVAGVGDATSDQERRRLEAERCAFNTALSALTIVYFLLDSPALESVSTDLVLAHTQELSRHVNVRIANVAKAFLSRFEELLASVDDAALATPQTIEHS